MLECQGGATLSSVSLIATNSRLKTTFGGSLLEIGRSIVIGGVRRAAGSALGRGRRLLWQTR